MILVLALLSLRCSFCLDLGLFRIVVDCGGLCQEVERVRCSWGQETCIEMYIVHVLYIHAMFTYNAKEFCKEHLDHLMLFFAHNLCLLNPLGLYVYSSFVFLLSSLTHDTDTKGS